jgi:hypothetical protein
MMKHEQDQSLMPPGPDLRNATKEEIIQYFDAYDFRDPIGHKLILCADFLDLLLILTYFKQNRAGGCDASAIVQPPPKVASPCPITNMGFIGQYEKR